MNDFIHFPHNQMLLSYDLHRGQVEEVLDGSLALLDISSSTLDALSQMKESILDLQSAIHRGSEIEGINAYLMSRKQIKKTISKCLAYLKNVEKNYPLVQQDNDSVTVRMLKEAETTSLSAFKSVLSYVMGKKVISQTRGWSLVAKLVKNKNTSHDAANATVVEELDCSLSALFKKHSGDETKVLTKQLDTLEMSIHDFKDDIESVSRCFVKTRVSLLNVLNQ